MTSKAAGIALALAVASGPLALTAALATFLAQPSAPAPASAATDPGEWAHSQALAEETGLRVLTAWLSATRDSPTAYRQLVPGAQLAALPSTSAQWQDLSVAGVGRDGQVWTVTVAVTVLSAPTPGPADQEPTARLDNTDDQLLSSEHPSASTGAAVRRYFEVAVVVDEASSLAAAVAAPAMVPGPPNVTGPQLDYREALASTSAPVQTVTRFFEAYLAGAGEVSRYTAPQAPIRAITPPVYDQVQVLEVRPHQRLQDSEAPTDGSRVDVLVTARGAVDQESSPPQSWALTLSARGGRWEVTALSTPHLRAAGEQPDQPGSSEPGTPTPSLGASP